MNAAIPRHITNTGWAPHGNTRGKSWLGAQEEIAALTLNDCGMVRDCSRAGEALFKYCRSELVLRHVSLLLPQLAALELMQDGQINPHLRFLCRVGHPFHAVTQDGEHFPTILFFNRVGGTAREGMILIVRPSLEHAGDGRSKAGGD